MVNIVLGTRVKNWFLAGLIKSWDRVQVLGLLVHAQQMFQPGHDFRAVCGRDIAGQHLAHQFFGKLANALTSSSNLFNIIRQCRASHRIAPRIYTAL